MDEVKNHYESLIDENNDPVRDLTVLKEYMDKWDGQAFMDELNLDAGKDVFEIGVGTGRIAVKVCGRCKSFTGIDFSPKTIMRARENLGELGNISLICADFLDYDFSGGFDVIYSSLTFMHIERKQDAICKAAGLLNPGGRFVLSVSKDQSAILDFGTRKISLFPDTPEAVAGYMKNAGLGIEKQFETEFAIVFVAAKK